MRAPILMPKLGYNMTSGFLVSWLVAVGDSVTRGQPIAVIETDKVELEMESVASGTLVEIVHGADAEVEVGEVIGYLETDQ